MTSVNRRRVLTGSAAVVVGGPLMAGCGASDSAQQGSGQTAADVTAKKGETLAAAADVPVNGCFVVDDAKVVLTQPTKGEFKAFSATCTHQGCAVRSAKDGVIPCPCHGSEFSLSDGSVVQGPATSPLPTVDIAVDGDSISLA